MTQPDTLIDSYRAAQKLQKNTGPSESTRRRIFAHAEHLANNNHRNDAIIFSENTTNLIAEETINTSPANDSQWKMRALASVAVFGIIGIMMLQLSKDAPEEFSPKAKSPVSAERAAESTTISDNDAKAKAKNSAQTQLQASAPAPAPATDNKPAASPAPSAASKSAPLREQSVNRNDSSSRDDVEVAIKKEPQSAKESKTETLADKAAVVTPPFAPPPPPSAEAIAPAPASSALAPASASSSAPATMAESAKLSRSAVVASRANTGAANATNPGTNVNAKLFNAIQAKDATALKLALDGGDDKNAKNADGTPALILCVQSEQLTLVRLLLAAGADVNAFDALGVSSLAHARNRGFTDIANLLLNFGAK